MTSHLQDDPRKQCSLCPNYATAECQVYDKKRKAICGLFLCHLHRKQTFGIDACAKHVKHERSRQGKLMVKKQQSLFDEIWATGGDAMKI